MKKKLLIITVIFLAAISIVIYCKINKEPNINSIEVLKNIENYKCNCTINIENTNQKLEYKCKQYYKRKIGSKIELEDKKSLVFKDNKIYVNDNNLGANYSLNKDFDKIFRISVVGEFIRLMYTNHEVKMYVKNIEGIEYDIIELTIPGVNRNLYKGRMYVDKKSHIPNNLEILDTIGKKRVDIKYNQFEPNIDLDDNIFKTT